MRYECIVIGGGAAGMIAAITAAKNGISTAIIEHTDRVGKKILQTGNGRCNLTNMIMNEDCYHNDDSSFTMQVIHSFPVNETIEFFKNLGIYPKSRNGYIYPNSDMAASVLDVLRMELERQTINVILETNIKSICSNHDNKNKTNFRIQTDKGVYECTSLIMATGSKAAPKTGSDGSGYQYAQNLGHTIIEPLPALVQLRSNLHVCKLMAGVRSEGKVRLYVNNEIVGEDTGEIQYTDYGISGIPIFQISGYAVRAVANKQNVEVRIDMLPSISKHDILALVFARLKTDGYKNIEQFFMGMLNKKLIGSITKVAGLKISDNMQGLGRANIERIVDIIKEFIVPIDGYHSFEHGQICSGGVKLSEVYPETMESKLVSNLYFAGEILDVDGICGGYNLQWAWSSGHLAGFSAAKNHELNT